MWNSRLTLNTADEGVCSPADLNENFTLANTYLKPKITPGNGLGSTFAITANQ
jgi:hypothetical protein